MKTTILPSQGVLTMFNASAAKALASTRERLAEVATTPSGIKPLKVWLGEENTMKDKLVLNGNFTVEDVMEWIANPDTFKARVIVGLVQSFPVWKSDKMNNEAFRNAIAEQLIGDNAKLRSLWDELPKDSLDRQSYEASKSWHLSRNKAFNYKMPEPTTK